MTKKTPHEQISENVDAAMDCGFRLQYGRHSPALATCRAENLVILGGLGAMGIGIMGFELEHRGKDVDDSTPDFETVEDANKYVIKEYGLGAINIGQAS